MTQRPKIRRQIRPFLALSLPLIGSQLAQYLIGVTDVVMMGWYGIEDLAAVVLANSLIFSLIIVGAGFGWAVMPLVAAASERNDHTQIRRVTRMGIWASMIYCLIVVPPFFFAKDLYLWLGQTPEVSRIAADFTRIAAPGVIPALMIMVLRSYLAALERTRVLLLATLTAAAINAFANYVLIFGNFGAPELGARGAAIASIIMNCAAALYLALYARHKLPEHELFVRIWRPDWAALRQVFRLGWPIGMTNLAEVGMFSASAIMMGWVGTQALAAHGIVLQLATAAFMIHIGLSQAATVRAGQAFGRSDKHQQRQAGQLALGISIAVSLVTVCIYLGFSKELVGAFLDPGNPERIQIIAIGTGLLAAAALFQLADGAQVVALGLLRGVQDTRAPMIFAVLSYWVIGAPTAWFLAFPLGMDGIGVWLGLVFGLTCAAVLMVYRFWRRTQ